MKNLIYKGLQFLCVIIAITAIIFPGAAEAGGAILGALTITPGAVTAEDTKTLAPGHLKRSISQIVTEEKPDDFPLDTMLRGIRASEIVDNVKVEFETVTYRGREDTITSFTALTGTGDADSSVAIVVGNIDIWGVDDGVYFPNSITGTVGSKPMRGHVVAVTPATNTITVTAVNGRASTSPAGFQNLVDLTNADPIKRMGTAKSELASITDVVAELPRQEFNYCQTEMVYIKRSKISAKHKSYSGYNYNDMVRQQIYNLRTALETTGMYGAKGRIVQTSTNEIIYRAGGITHDITQTLEFGSGSSAVDPTLAEVMALLELGFAGNSGSEKRLLLCGKELITGLSLITVVREIGPVEKMVIHGVSVDVLHSKFGDVYIKHSKVMDEFGDTGVGYLLDLDNIYKHDLEPMTRDLLDPDKAGTERVRDAVRILETCCVTLRYPATHVKWYPKVSA